MTRAALEIVSRAGLPNVLIVVSPFEPVPAGALARAWVRGLAPALACVSALPAPL